MHWTSLILGWFENCEKYFAEKILGPERFPAIKDVVIYGNALSYDAAALRHGLPKDVFHLADNSLSNLDPAYKEWVKKEGFRMFPASEYCMEKEINWFNEE